MSFEFINEIITEAKKSAPIKYFNTDQEITYAEAKKMVGTKKNAGELLKWENPPEMLIKAAFKKEPALIYQLNKKYITDELIATAIAMASRGFETARIINLVSAKVKISDKVFLAVMEKSKNADFFPSIKKPSDKVILAALDFNPNYLGDVEKPSKKVIDFAMKKDPQVFRFVEHPSDALVKAAIEADATNIQHIDNPTEKQKEMAIKKDPETIEYWADASEKLQMLAMKIDPKVIRFIEEPSPKLIIAAAKKDKSVLKHLEYVEIDEMSDSDFATIFKLDPDQRAPDEWNFTSDMSEAKMKVVAKLRPKLVLWMTDVPSNIWLMAAKADHTIFDDLDDTDLSDAEKANIPQLAFDAAGRTKKYGIENPNQKQLAFEAEMRRLAGLKG